MRRKLLAAILAAGLLCAAFCACAEETSYTLEGLITEVGDGYFIMTDISQGEVRVNLDDAVTVYDGVAAKDAMTAGEYVYVRYNGIMTRSLPPQVTAEKVGCYVVSGTVGDILDNGFTVEGDSVLGTVIVHAGNTLPPIYAGVPVTLYYNSVMALSYPPQISAAYAVVPTLTGTVSNAGEAGFTLTAADGTACAVTVDTSTDILTLPADGETVLVYYSGTLSQDGSAAALAVMSPDSQADAEES